MEKELKKQSGHHAEISGYFRTKDVIVASVMRTTGDCSAAAPAVKKIAAHPAAGLSGRDRALIIGGIIVAGALAGLGASGTFSGNGRNKH